jgi:hypothetical protein
LKLALLYSLLMVETSVAKLVSTDRYIIKIVDRSVSFQDFEYQLRNLKALNCIYDDSLVIKYFHDSFIKETETFVAKFPSQNDEVVTFLHQNEPQLLKLRHFFKMLRYSEDQKSKVSPVLSKLIRDSSKENKCGTSVLYKDTLKTNFIALMQMEIYLRSRYGHQMKTENSSFDSIRPSIDLFVESLDKQFSHEYYW